MRESLGVAFDTSSISTALVDADTPMLGSIDESYDHYGVDGIGTSDQECAAAVVAAVEVAKERAVRTLLSPGIIGVTSECADVLDLVHESLGSDGYEVIELVNGLDARVAYLRTVDTPAVLAYWLDGEDAVVVAVATTTGDVMSESRHESAGLLSTASAFAATLGPIVAQVHPTPTALIAMGVPDEVRELSANAAEFAGLSFTCLTDSAHVATGAALVAAARRSRPMPITGAATSIPAGMIRAAAAIVVPLVLVLTGVLIAMYPDDSRATSTDRMDVNTVSPVPSPAPESPVPTLPPCDPVVPGAPAGLRLSDPDLAPPSSIPTSVPCDPVRHG